MSLPPYNSSVYWKEYEIDTPTFDLAPVEKPDMSPFLFHMTGKNQILSILSDEEIGEGNGFLKACIPESNEGKYNASVVCFTESPTFALDFFRYRSFRRWSDNQMFGIGFSKSALVKAGVRPCVYADDELKTNIINLKYYVENLEIENENFAKCLQTLSDRLYPLTTPLLENFASQGFMWEREWRLCPTEKPEGLSFPFESIRIICCPASEENEIKEILGDHSRNINFVRSWKEYNEVVDYLTKRKSDLYIPDSVTAPHEQERLEDLKEQLNKHKSLFNKLSGYREVIERFENPSESLDVSIKEIEDSIAQIDQSIRKIESSARKI